jgi:hypothetical protein
LIRRLGLAAWLGLALAALFFYPIADLLNADVYYLQWRREDAIEAGAAIALLALVIGAAIYHLWPRADRVAAVGLFAVAALPLLSLAAGVARQLPFDDAVRAAANNPLVRYAVPLVAVAGLAAMLMRSPDTLNRGLRSTLLALSPIALVVLLTIGRSAWRPETTVFVERPSPAGVAGAICAPVIALLFDELSFAYLYEGGDVRPDYAEIARFGADATHHLNVRAAANETLAAVPSMLAARQYSDVRIESDGIYYVAPGAQDVQPLSVREPDGLFATARRLGYRTEMAGYYLSYCDMLGDLVDACRSLSFYNAGATTTGFSILAPIRTTFVLWPRQFPFGVLKNPFFTRFQRDLVAETEAFVRRPIDPSRQVFRLVHFSIPHLPFVFSGDGFDPPLNPLRTDSDADYVRQLAYVDRVVGETLSGLRQSGTYDRSTIVLLSDHGWRFGGTTERDVLHVPFIAKFPNQRERRDISESEQGELLLKQVLEQSCSPAPPAPGPLPPA